ncbi:MULTISPECIES: hypothetical protein [unclassified Bradyrhizobium]|uniref:hypothetical protein n=1 Tax=unclassified Bradyrhizobium TaxID=2631580 RepID=UPI002916E5ED|nr:MULTISPECIES: hypothetical protein [unclassified Bradyrhizobium]
MFAAKPAAAIRFPNYTLDFLPPRLALVVFVETFSETRQMAFDAEKFLNTPRFALDQLGVLSNVADFLTFSEDNIAHQKAVALQGVEKDVADAGLEKPEVFSYREHLLHNIDFRFDVALPMRVRYAALTAFTSTIEWSMTVLKPSFHVTQPPKRTALAIHLLTVFAERCDLPLTHQIRYLEFLIWVRNSIMHNAGALKGYKHEPDIRASISAYQPNFTISNWHYIGDTVEIKRGALEPLIESWSEIIRELYTVATKRKLLLF